MRKLLSNNCFLRSLKVFLFFFWFVAIAADMHLPSTQIKTAESNGLTFSFTTSQPTSLVPPTMSTTTRGNFFSNTEGQFIFNNVLHMPEYFNGSGWKHGAESGAIVNADVASGAAIVYGKLSLANSILNADVATGAAIDYLKLNLALSIVNADVSNTAAIARGKIANGTSNRVVVNSSGGVLTDAAAITAARALISDANGIPTHSTTTSTELAFVNGVTSSLCGINQSCTEINKTFTTPTIDVLLATEQSSTPATPSAGTKKIYCKTDGFCYTKDSAGVEAALGSGGAGGNIGDREFISNTDIETSKTGYTEYANAAGVAPVNGTGGSPISTVSRVTIGAITKTGSLQWDKTGTANRQGEGFSIPFSFTGTGDFSKDEQVEFDYVVGIGTFVIGTPTTDSDMEIYLYDVTNSTLIPLSDKKLYISDNTKATHFSAIFRTSLTGTSYRLIFHTATTSTANYSVRFDNVSVHPYRNMMVSPVSDMVDAGPIALTSSGGGVVKGTTTVDHLWYRRNGQNLEGRIEFKMTGAGTAGTGDYLIALPSGLVADTSKVTPNATVYGSGSAPLTENNLGSAWLALGSAGNVGTGNVTLFDSTHVRFTYVLAVGGAAGVWSAGGFPLSAAMTASAQFSVPIVGWTASQAAVRMDQSDYGPTAYTPTFTGLGTVTSVSLFHERKGANLRVYGTFTPGTVSGTVASITLPGTLTLDTSRISISNTSSNPGMMVGNFEQAEAVANTRGVMVTATGTSTALVYFGNSEVNASSAITPGAGTGVTASNVMMTVDFLVPISGWTENQSAPLLVGGLTTSSLGMERIERAYIANSGTPSVTTQSGDWVSSLTDNGTGDTTVNFKSGYFLSTPSCTCNSIESGGGFTVCGIKSISSSSVRTFIGANPTAFDRDFTLICVGPR